MYILRARKEEYNDSEILYEKVTCIIFTSNAATMKLLHAYFIPIKRHQFKYY